MRILLFIFICTYTIFADIWKPAKTKIVTSSDMKHLVKIDQIKPDSGRWYSEATIYNITPDSLVPIVTYRLHNGHHPVSAFLTNESKLITIDQHRQAGREEVIILYKADGTIQKKYTLDELYKTDALMLFWNEGEVSNTSIWWRSSKESSWMARGLLHIPDAFDGEFVLNIKTGAITYSQPNRFWQFKIYEKDMYSYLFTSIVLLGILFLVRMRFRKKERNTES